MRTILLIVFNAVLFMTACGSQTRNGAETSKLAATSDTYATIKPILDAHCATCHGANSRHPLATSETLKSLAARAFDLVNHGKMPARDPDFRTTDDGKRLLAWLGAGAP